MSYTKYKIPFPFIDIFFIVWKPNALSKIHNHSKSGCWMFILKGEITLFDGYTILYKKKEKDTQQMEKLSKLKKGDKINYKEIKSDLGIEENITSGNLEYL